MATGDKDSLQRQAYYAEGDTATSIVGIPALAEGAANTLQALQVDASKHLQVDIAASSVSGISTTQYTEASTDSTITGTAIMWEDSSETLRAVSASKPLPVDVQDTSITVDATNLDIRDFTAVSDSILMYVNTAKHGTGTNYVPLADSDGHLQVYVLSGGGAGTE